MSVSYTTAFHAIIIDRNIEEHNGLREGLTMSNTTTVFLYQGGQQEQENIHPCEQPRETGPCDRFVTKWYYNKADGTCNRFHYGGCEGNANRYDTENACKAECGEYAGEFSICWDPFIYCIN
ncbi:unnamed protein product [Anisakis simplex]|uniref:BPTI/Kunitz inhibitor domain-containing protein n=1 Tax=Anisakis simplex TaxID=6269 RepID=A0A0M3KH91_ANISI|nr:unnamed protein product [Anisakis simplex]